MADFHPLVSIVIPVYNGSNYLECAINSALEQDYDNIEVIVVNDGSTDTTEEIAKSYGDKIRYFSKENGGVSTALNLALKNARGEYISWLSHDDYYLPNKISRQIEELGCINDHDNIIILSDFIDKYIYDDNEENVEKKVRLNIPHFSCLSRIESLNLIFAGEIHGCTLLIPKIAFEETGYFDETLLTTQDYDLWFRFIGSGYRFFYVPELLIISRKHKQQVSKRKIKLAKREQKKMFNYFYVIYKNDMNKAEKIFMQNTIKRYSLSFIFICKIKEKIKMIIPKSIMRYFKKILYKSS